MNWPEMIACQAMTGEMDLLLRVHGEDMTHFSRIMMDTLLKHPAKKRPRCRWAENRKTPEIP